MAKVTFNGPGATHKGGCVWSKGKSLDLKDAKEFEADARFTVEAKKAKAAKKD